MSRLEKIPLYLNKGIFQKLFKIAEVSKLTEAQRRIYESNLKAKWDYKNGLAAASAEAGAKAKIEGKLEERSAIARELRETGMSVEQVSRITKLSVEEIILL